MTNCNKLARLTDLGFVEPPHIRFGLRIAGETFLAEKGQSRRKLSSKGYLVSNS